MNDSARNEVRDGQAKRERRFSQFACEFGGQAQKKVVIGKGNRAGTVRQANDLASFFKGGDEAVNTAFAAQPEMVVHFLKRRRHASFSQAIGDEIIATLLHAGHRVAHTASLPLKMAPHDFSVKKFGHPIAEALRPIWYGVPRW